MVVAEPPSGRAAGPCSHSPESAALADSRLRVSPFGSLVCSSLHHLSDWAIHWIIAVPPVSGVRGLCVATSRLSVREMEILRMWSRMSWWRPRSVGFFDCRYLLGLSYATRLKRHTSPA